MTSGFNAVQTFANLGLRSSFHLAAEGDDLRIEGPIGSSKKEEALNLYRNSNYNQKLVMQHVAIGFLWSLPYELEGQARRWKKQLCDPRQSDARKLRPGQQVETWTL